MKKEDLQYIKEALEYALNDYTPSPQMAETHFNTFSNAISLIDDFEKELNIPVVSQQRQLFKSFLEKVNRDIEYGGDLTWQTRDEAKELLKLLNCG